VLKEMFCSTALTYRVSTMPRIAPAPGDGITSASVDGRGRGGTVSRGAVEEHAAVNAAIAASDRQYVRWPTAATSDFVQLMALARELTEGIVGLSIDPQLTC
jgi:hypothetical protein